MAGRFRTARIMAVLMLLAGLMSTMGAQAEPVRADKHMVAAANPIAARAGLDILRQGGSAIDAAIAVQAMLTLVEPQSSGIGGGAFLLYWDAASKQLTAFDGRETAPANVDPSLFLGPDGKPLGFIEALVGGRAVGVPGVVAMLGKAHARYGALDWSRLFDAAIERAEAGFKVSPRLNLLIGNDDALKTRPTARDYFFTEAGEPLPVGHVLKNPELAQTFRTLAERGPRSFYTGPIARQITEAVRGDPQNPGLMTLTDLAVYEAKARPPLCREYRDWQVCTMPPPTSGGIATLQILGVLESFDLASLEPGSLEAVHLIAEASRLAFADRGLYVADSDFVDVPVEGLLRTGYLAARASQIDPAKSMGKARPGDPDEQARLWAPDEAVELPSTSHFVIVDAAGNMVSMTSSVEFRFGAHIMAGGFILNNQLTDFSFRPRKDGRIIANAVAPGKRPRSSMSPTIVLDREGRPVIAVGSPGGSRIIGYVAKSLIAMLDWGMGPQAALDLPHFVNRNGATDLEEDTTAAELAKGLEALGHEVKIRKLTSGLHAIRITQGGLEGGADHRREGIAVGD